MRFQWNPASNQRSGGPSSLFLCREARGKGRLMSPPPPSLARRFSPKKREVRMSDRRLSSPHDQVLRLYKHLVDKTTFYCSVGSNLRHLVIALLKTS